MRRALPWAALLAALSPILLELFEHARAYPWAGVWPVFLMLFFVLEARSADRASARSADRASARSAAPASSAAPGAPYRGLGRLGLVVTAVAVVVFVGGREPRLARLAVPLGFVSMACMLGRPALRPALLAIWLVPLPAFLPDLVHPQLTNLWLRLSELLVPGVELIAPKRALGDPGLGLAGDGMSFAVHEGFNGIALAWALCGVGCFQALRMDPRVPVWALVRSGAIYGVWGLPAQAAVILMSAAVLSFSGSTGAAESAMNWGWVAPVAIALGFGLRAGADAR